MRLVIDGEEKQKIEAVLGPPVRKLFPIKGTPTISGENHINPQAIKTFEDAHLVLKNIIDSTYEESKQATIEITYK